MPQYDFVCRKCQRRFSRIISISEYEKSKNGTKCPRCGSTKTERRWEPFYAVTSKKS